MSRNARDYVEEHHELTKIIERHKTIFTKPNKFSIAVAGPSREAPNRDRNMEG
jgi:hypothetical protein